MAETDRITEAQATLSTQNTLVMQEPLLAKSETPPVKMVEEVGDPPKERNGSDEAPKKAPKIKYTAECISYSLPSFEVSQDEPFPSQAPPDNDAANKPILEVVTSMTVSLDKNSTNDKENAKTLEGKIIDKINHTRIVIHSAQLSKIIREMVDYYPDQSTAGEVITIFHPYSVLAHHWERLAKTHERLRASASKSERDQIDCEHLDVLIGFMSPIMRTKVDPIRRRLEHETPTATWDDLWYVLRPGTKSYCKHDDQWMGCIIEKTGKREEDRDEGEPERWRVHVWFLCVHYWRGTLITATQVITIPKYDGERNILDLDVYPQAFFDTKDGGARSRKFEERGSRIFGILKTGHEYVNYDGELMDEKKSKYKGQMIVSPFGDTESASDLEDDEWGFDVLPEPSDPITPGTAASEILPQLWLDPKKDKEDLLLTAAHKVIVCPVLGAFLLPRKTWASVHIAHFRPLDSDANIPDAIIGDDKLKIVKALAERQITNKPWSADYIKNKGEGVVILLHGPPGVGKTYTVESIAMKKRQPLISLSISEIGTQEATLEASLTRWFSMADKWRAILLIDECDIFLERREHKDIHRNGVVSAFLRKMEYFGGLLFLTTNRVMTIDDAFVSRVHAIIGFERLDSARREKIWDNLMKKLTRDCGGKIRVSNHAKMFLKSPEVKETDWNGREIRNTFQTAIALAEYEAKGFDDYNEKQEIIVEAEHFREVLEMSKTFRSYLNSLRNHSEAQRAKFAKWRNDEWQEGDDERAKGNK